MAKVLGIDEVYEGREFVDLSPRYMYPFRANDGGGMYLPNAMDLGRTRGMTTESLLPSDNKGETAMNVKSDITPAMDAVAIKYKTAGWVQLPIDIEAIASITSMGKGVLLGNRFDYDEWTDYPTVNPNSKRSCGHGTAGVDNVLSNGKQYIVMDDSWGPRYAKFGQRYLSQEWLKARCFFAGYTINFIYESNTTDKPIHLFTKWMRKGDKNADVVALQDILKYEGLFPLNVESTGLYGPATQRAVRKFQDKYLGSNNDGIQVGPKTLEK
jgi:hypothetical protein